MKKLFLVMLALTLTLAAGAQRTTDVLDRGLVAVPSGSGNLVSWRIFAEEYYGVTYNLYKNGSLIAEGLEASDYLDAAGGSGTAYQVAPVVKGVEKQKSAYSTYFPGGYIQFNVAGVVDRNGNNVTDQYIINDISLGDVDGDGVTEFLVKRNYTGDIRSASNTTCFHHYECYKLDGTRLWWIDLGPNMMAGPDEQWDCVMFDWDQDGKAEGIMRGADNMIFHSAAGDINIGNMNYVAPRDEYTHQGAEYLIYINGLTGVPYGAESKTAFTPMIYPLPRFETGEAANPLNATSTEYANAWGKADTGHRSSKHYFGAPFLDGRHPSVFLGRGCYTRHKMCALDVDPATHLLSVRWRWANNGGWSDPWFGNGYHNFGIADVDEDGRDEIVFGSMVIDDNGKGLSTTGLGHGDAEHCGDFDPYRKGLEFLGCNEDEPNMNYRNATTSKMYYRSVGTGDDGRALVGNFSNNFPGCMGRSTNTPLISTVKDKELTGSGVPSTSGTNDGLFWSHLNQRIYWTGDLLEGILDSPGTERDAVVWHTTKGRVFQSNGCKLNNDSKNNPCALADIFGDWREEIVIRSGDNASVRIYSTPVYTQYRIPTLWHDHQYRNAMVWQCVGYNQPPHKSFFLGELEGITMAPPPYTMTGRTEIANGGTISTANAGQHVIVCETNDTHITIADGANPDVATFNVPSWVQGTGSSKTDGTAVINYEYYTCTVDGGAFTGGMTLAKQGDGILTLPAVNMTYTGGTNVWAGTLNFDGQLPNSTTWINRFATLNSKGSFRCIKAEYAANVNPGGENALGTLTTDSLVLRFGSRVKLDVFADGQKADGLNIGKLLSIETKTTSEWLNYGPEYLKPVFEIVPHYAAGESLLPGGRYELGTAPEKMEGTLSDIKLEGINNQKLALVEDGGKIYLEVTGMRGPATVYWQGDKSNVWDLAQTENFKNVDEDDIFVNGDVVNFDDAATEKSVILDSDLSPAELNFIGSKGYTLSGTGKLTGAAKINQSGTGVTTIMTDNMHTGATTISGGTLTVNSLSNSSRAYGALGAYTSGSSPKITLSGGGTLKTTAEVTCGSIITTSGTEGGVIDNASGFTTQKAITGTLLTKKGAGNLKFGVAPTVSKIVMTAGSIALSVNTTKPIELQGGTLYDDAQNTTHAISVPEGKKATWDLTTAYYTGYRNNLTGSGTLTIVPRNSVSRVRIESGWNNFQGTIVHSTGINLPLKGSMSAPKLTLQVNEGCTVASTTGYTYTLGAVTGEGTLTSTNLDYNSSTPVAAGFVTWNIGNAVGKDFTFAGAINELSSTHYCVFNKVGSCTMTYTGPGMNITHPVSVNGGLILNNSNGADLGSGTLTLKSGATLTSKASTLRSSAITAQSGSAMCVTSCTFNGASMNFQSGSSLTVGDLVSTVKAVGTLEAGSANIIVSNDASCEMYIYNNTLCSVINTTGKLTLNGTFKLTYNTGRKGVVAKNLPSFKLVDAGTITLGSDFAFDLQELPAGYYWDTRTFATDGIVNITNVDPTGINELRGTTLDSGELTDAYTISGTYVGRPTKPGIYIQNGQKYVVK